MSPSLLDRTLYHRSLLARAASLAVLGAALHMLAWTLGYRLLPAEALKGVFLSSRIPVAGGSQGGTLARILVLNLVLGVGFTAAANLFRVGRLPLGYVPVLFHWTAFGVLNGTGSFAVARAPRPPSLRGLLSSRGCWEILAYTLVAAATVGLFIYRQTSWLDWSTRKERSLADVTMPRSAWAAIVVALVLLAAANWTEARSLVGG